jgi:hypothetical protein
MIIFNEPLLPGTVKITRMKSGLDLQTALYQRKNNE